MAGLNVGVGGLGTRFNVGGGASVAAPATLVTSGYGEPPAQTTGGVEPWHLGVAVPVAIVVFGMFLRWSLPG